MRFFYSSPRLPYLLTYCALAFVGLACESPVDPGFEIKDPELVVSSTFFPDDVVKVRLSGTTPTGGEQILSDIADATVVILEGDETAEVLEYVPGIAGRPGFYSANEFRPIVGRLYTLFATRNGYVPFEATSSCPVAVPISELTIENVETLQKGDLTVYNFDLLINYPDNVIEENYYDLRISQKVTPFHVNVSGDTITQPERTKLLQEPNDVEAGAGSTEAGETSILVRNRPMLSGFKTRLQSRINSRNELLGPIVAELRTVSPAYYNFHLAFQREGAALPLGVGNPRVNINSIGNARSGVGVFGGYSRTQAEVRINP